MFLKFIYQPIWTISRILRYFKRFDSFWSIFSLWAILNLFQLFWSAPKTQYVMWQTDLMEILTYAHRSIWDLYPSTWAIQLYPETFIKHWWNISENIWYTLEITPPDFFFYSHIKIFKISWDTLEILLKWTMGKYLIFIDKKWQYSTID